MSGYYSSYDVKAAVVAFAVMMVAYLGTMAPTVTLEQSGAMVVAADSAGIGKIPGFPIWHLLTHGFTWLFSSATYRGQPNPAFATNVMSVWFGALACGTIALLVSRLTRSMMPASREVSLRPITSAAAIASAVMFGFTPAMWSQSVITETHSLTNFYAAAFLAVLLYWVHTRCRHGDLVVAFLFGLALSVSQQLGLFAPVVLLAAAWCGRKHLVQMGVAMLIVGLFVWGVYRAAFFVSIWLVAAGGGCFHRGWFVVPANPTQHRNRRPVRHRPAPACVYSNSGRPQSADEHGVCPHLGGLLAFGWARAIRTGHICESVPGNEDVVVGNRMAGGSGRFSVHDAAGVAGICSAVDWMDGAIRKKGNVAGVRRANQLCCDNRNGAWFYADRHPNATPRRSGLYSRLFVLVDQHGLRHGPAV